MKVWTFITQKGALPNDLNELTEKAPYLTWETREKAESALLEELSDELNSVELKIVGVDWVEEDFYMSCKRFTAYIAPLDRHICLYEMEL